MSHSLLFASLTQIRESGLPNQLERICLIKPLSPASFLGPNVRLRLREGRATHVRAADEMLSELIHQQFHACRFMLGFAE